MQKTLDISEQQAKRLHMEIWLFTHGIETVIATSFFDMDDDMISAAISLYHALGR